MTTSAPPPKAPSHWDENKNNSDGEIKGVELGFSSLTLSPHFSGGGRPPALSVSSLSTIGDDHTQPQNRSGESIINSSVGTPPSPSSPPRRYASRQVGPPQSIGEAYQGNSTRGTSLPSPIGTASRPTTSNSSTYASSSPLIIRSSPSDMSNSDQIFGSYHGSTHSFLTDKPPPPPPKLGSARDIDAVSINNGSNIEGKSNGMDKASVGFQSNPIDAPLSGVPFSAVGHLQKDHRVGSLDGGYNMISNKNVITPRRSPKLEGESPLLSSSFDLSHQRYPERSPGSHYFDDGGLIGLGVLKDRQQSPPRPNLTSTGGVGHRTPSSPTSEIVSSSDIPCNAALSTFSAPSDNRNTHVLERLLSNHDQTKHPGGPSSRGLYDGNHFNSRPPLSSNRISIEGKLNESPSFNSYEQHGAQGRDLLPNQQLDNYNSDMDIRGGSDKSRIDNAFGGPPRPNLRHTISDITNGRARLSPGTSMFGGSSISIGGSSSFVDEHSQAERISRQYPPSRARAASMGSPDGLGVCENLQPQGINMSHAMGSHGSSFDDGLRGRSYQGHGSSMGPNIHMGREEARQMHLMKTQSIQARQPVQSDNYHLRRPQILHDQHDQQQHRQLHTIPHHLQGALQRQNHQRHPQAQDCYDDNNGRHGQADIRIQHHTSNIQHQRDTGGHFLPHNAPHRQEVSRGPLNPGVGGRPNLEPNSGSVPGLDGNRFDGHNRSVSSGSDIMGMMSRSGNVPPQGTPLTPRDGSSCHEYGPNTIDPYHQNQQSFSGHQHSGHAGQVQFQHDRDMGHLCQPHLGANRVIQQRFSGEEFHGTEVVCGEVMHDGNAEQCGSGAAPIFPHMEDVSANVNDISANRLGMGRGDFVVNDPVKGLYGGNVQQPRIHNQQHHFAQSQRRVEPSASPVSHHTGAIMLTPTQHHDKQHTKVPLYDPDFGNPLPVERIDGSPMAIGMDIPHNVNGAPQDSMNPHHPYQQAGVLATHIGARGGPVHHPAPSPSQSISSGAPSVEQMLPTGLPPHFLPIDSAQQHQQVTSSSTNAAGPRVVYNVKFKRTQRSFILGQRIPRDIKIGCYVKVEADRGEDLGIVLSRMPAEKFNASGRSNFRMGAGTSPGGVTVQGVGEISPTIGGVVPSGANPGGAADLKRIIRLATHDEVSLLAVQREEEDELLKICKAKVRQRGLPMNVVDAEYQFDRHKLTFFFEAEGRIDFRELVRDLFSIYKTRIWMQQLDKNGVSSSGGCGDQSSGSVSPSNDAGQSSVVSFTSEDSDSGRHHTSIARDNEIDKHHEFEAKNLKYGDLATRIGQREETE